MTARLQNLTPVLEDADRMAANVLGVFPELRMHIAYVMMLRDEDGNGRAMRANTALEQGEMNRERLIAFLREAADALENTEHHHGERRGRISASGEGLPGS